MDIPALTNLARKGVNTKNSPLGDYLTLLTH